MIENNTSPVGGSLTQIAEHGKMSVQEEFIETTPRCTIDALKHTMEQKSTFVVLGTIDSVETGRVWWYDACNACHRRMIEHYYNQPQDGTGNVVEGVNQNGSSTSVSKNLIDNFTNSSTEKRLETNGSNCIDLSQVEDDNNVNKRPIADVEPSGIKSPRPKVVVNIEKE